MTTADRSTPEITVFLPAWQGAGVVGDTIRALGAQRGGAPFDVVVADDGSTDGTAAVAADAMLRLPPHISGRVVRLPVNSGVGAACAAALEGVATPLVVLINDDCTPRPDWMETLLRDWSAAGPEVAGIGGFVTARDLDTVNRRYLAARDPHRPLEIDYARPMGFARRIRLAVHRPNRSGIRPVHSLIGGCMSLRRSALDAVGGFDPSIRFGGPETDVCNRVRERFGEGSLIADPALVVPHQYEADLSSTVRRAWRAGKGAGRDWARHGGLPRVRPAMPLAFAAALAAAPVGAAVGAMAAVDMLPAAIAAAAAACFAVSTWAFRDLLRLRQPESAIYPVIAAAEETIANAGVIAGARAERRKTADRRHAERRQADRQQADRRQAERRTSGVAE